MPQPGGILRQPGDDLASLSSRERARRVAVVPQETYPVFDFTVEEIVRMGRAPHLGLLGFEGPRDRAVAREAMERCEVAQTRRALVSAHSREASDNG